MSSLEDRRHTFNEVAELYDRVRPGYPEPLIDDVVRLSGIPAGGAILEVGSGTGKATLPFARRGYAITCIEPGDALARVARARLAAYPNVRIVVTRFEQWPVSPGFDLVIAAQSFHFLDFVEAPRAMAAALRPGGAVAVFGNHPARSATPLADRIQAAYARHAPALVPEQPPTPVAEVLLASGAFEIVATGEYPWRADYSATEYVDLMNTQSHHRLLPPERREALLQDIRTAIETAGGRIAIDYVTRLVLARRHGPSGPAGE